MNALVTRFLVWLLLGGSVWASPFLVADPYPVGLDQSSKPVSFILKGLGASPISIPATVNSDGTVQLRYDLAALPNGNYTVIADAVNQFGGVSLDSAPFTFTRGIPNAPINLKIVSL